jgi:hypothetical protein
VRKGTIAALIVGGALGLASLEMGDISSISANALVGYAQQTLMYLLVPGLVGSMAFSGNAHAFSLGTAAVVNGVLYFGLVKLIVWIATRSKRKAERASKS